MKQFTLCMMLFQCKQPLTVKTKKNIGLIWTFKLESITVMTTLRLPVPTIMWLLETILLADYGSWTDHFYWTA